MAKSAKVVIRLRNMRLQLIGENKFRERLSAPQIQAIYNWHGAWSGEVRGYYAMSPDERSNAGDKLKQFVKDIEDVVDQGFLYRGRAYRGLSAGKWHPKNIDYLRRLIDGDSEVVFPAPASATRVESIGRGFMRCDRNDPADVTTGHHLAVLLICDCESARCLPSFVHSASDESEVIIKRGTRFKRTSSRRLCDQNLLMESHEVTLVEIVGQNERDAGRETGTALT